MMLLREVVKRFRSLHRWYFWVWASSVWQEYRENWRIRYEGKEDSMKKLMHMIAVVSGLMMSTWAQAGQGGPTNVPEPISLLLLGVGIIGLAGLRRKMK